MKKLLIFSIILYIAVILALPSIIEVDAKQGKGSEKNKGQAKQQGKPNKNIITEPINSKEIAGEISGNAVENTKKDSKGLNKIVGKNKGKKTETELGKTTGKGLKKENGFVKGWKNLLGRISGFGFFGFKRGGKEKVTICHIPPGNPENAHTITVGAPAVRAHVANHGDTIGPCVKDNETEPEEEIGEGGGFAGCLQEPTTTVFNETEIEEMNFTFVKIGLNHFSQFNDPLWGNNSCAPVAVGVSFEYFNLSNNQSLHDLIDNLRVLMQTTNEGTEDRNVLLGKIAYLNNISEQGNFTITWINEQATASGNDTDIVHEGVELHLRVRKPNFTDFSGEMLAGEDVTFLMRNETNISHFMTGYAFNSGTNANGNHDVAFMDPSADGFIVAEMADDGTIIIDGNSFEMVSMEAVSPK